jgi:large subunit ribosomal protein L18
MNLKAKRLRRERRHRRVRAKIKGTAERPRLSVFRSNRYIWAQLVDDTSGRTVGTASDRDALYGKKGKREALARKLGALVAKHASDKKITRVVFDRGAYKYHGLVRSVAEGARKEGLEI